MKRWETLGPELERLRDAEIRSADTAAAIRMFATAFRVALRDLPPRESSGLVEWQKIVIKWRDRERGRD